jgi:hypothetical protein
MERTAAACELSTRFAAVTAADDAAIRQLLRDNPMRGAISVSFEREPNYFRGVNVAGGEDETIVAFADERLVCMGRCTRRECWVNGRATRTGYLAELRLDAAARGRFGILRDGYRFFHEQQDDDLADLYFTSIAADNDRARRLLERGMRGLPKYVFLSELDTVLVAVPRHPGAAKLHVEAATPSHVPDLVRLLNSQRHHLATVWTADRLRALEDHGLPLNRFLIARDGGEAIACGALWDQRGFRQTVISSYTRSLAIARPVVNLASHIFGTPRLPSPGSLLSHAFLSPLAFASGAEAALPDFVESFFRLAAQCDIEFLTLALPATDPRLPTLRQRFSTRTWRSRLYRVDWSGQAPTEFIGAPFLPDVALL